MLFLGYYIIILSDAHCFIELAELVGELLHVMFYFLVCYSRINLGYSDIRMSKHLRHRFHRNTLGYRHSSKSMASHVKGKILFYATKVGNFFQIRVDTLIAHHRKNLSSLSVNIVIFPNNGKWNVQQHDIFVNTCLVSLGDEPLPVLNSHNLIVSKIVNINISQPCEAGKKVGKNGSSILKKF